MIKRVLIITLLLFASQSFFSQEKETSKNFNEVKINGLYLVVGAFEATYERTLNEESGVGITFFKPFDEDIDINYFISPYYRLYFGKKYAAGFFIEGFGMLNSYEYDNYSYNETTMTSSIKNENITDFALGIGVGGKWVTKSGFIGELSLGVGRNLFNTDNENYSVEEVVGKVGITLGYRF